MSARIPLRVRVDDVAHRSFLVGWVGQTNGRDGPVKMRFQPGLTVSQMIQLHVIQSDFFNVFTLGTRRTSQFWHC